MRSLVIFSLSFLIIFKINGEKKGTIADTQFVIEKERKNLLDESKKIFLQPAIPSLYDKKTVTNFEFHELSNKYSVLARKTIFVPEQLIKSGAGYQHEHNLSLGFLNTYLNFSYFGGYPLKKVLKYDSYAFFKAYLVGIINNRKVDLSLNNQINFEKFCLRSGFRMYKTNSFIKNYDPHIGENETPLDDSSNKNNKLFLLSNSLSLESLGNKNLNHNYLLYFNAFKKLEKKGWIERDYMLAFNLDYLTIYKFNFFVESRFYHIFLTHPLIKENRMLWQLMPQIKANLGKFSGALGVSLSTHNDKDVSNNLLIDPHVEVLFRYNNRFSYYASAIGTVDKVGYVDLVKGNPSYHLADKNFDIKHAHKQILELGVKAAFSSVLNLKLFASLSKFDNLFFFKDSSSSKELNNFQVLYKKALLFNPGIDLAYESSNKALKVSTSMSYFYYLKKLDLDFSYYKPKYKVKFDFIYKLNSVIQLFGSCDYLAGILIDKDQYLPKFLDLSIGADYKINSSWLAFAKVTNLFNRKNALYRGFSSRGIELNVGVLFSV
jgi:hypothetical protein